MRLREIVGLRGAVNSEEALQAALPWPWRIVYVQEILHAAVCEATAPDTFAPEVLREMLDAALSNARVAARAA